MSAALGKILRRGKGLPEPNLLDDVLAALDRIELDQEGWRDEWSLDGRVPASTIADMLGVSIEDVEAALYALVTTNMVGEEPPGYYWTDRRDAQFTVRNPNA